MDIEEDLCENSAAGRSVGPEKKIRILENFEKVKKNGEDGY